MLFKLAEKGGSSLRARSVVKIIAGFLAVSLAAGCDSSLNDPIDVQPNAAQPLKNTFLENTVLTENEKAEPRETTTVLKNPDVVYLGIFDCFEKAGEKFQKNLLDFGVVNADVYVNEVHDCYIVQACESIKGEDIFQESGLVETHKDNDFADNSKANPEEGIKRPGIQTVIIGDDAKKIKAVQDWASSSVCNEALDSSSYFSEALGCDVKFYFGERAEFDQKVGISFAVIEQENMVYTLAFQKEDYESLEDFERNVKKVTE